MYWKQIRYGVLYENITKINNELLKLELISPIAFKDFSHVIYFIKKLVFVNIQ